MKKITILLLISTVCFSGFCQSRKTFLKETFDNPVLPSGWTIENYVSNWTVSNSSNAGGEPFELRLSNFESVNEKTRVISPVINTTGATNLFIEFIHFYMTWYGKSPLGIETTSNGGATWTKGWERVYEGYDYDEVIGAISTPDVGSATFQFCLYCQGNNSAVIFWFFDNFELYSLENLDAQLISVNNAEYVVPEFQKVDFTFANRGFTTITSIEVEYQFENLTPIIETFSSLNMVSSEIKTLSFTEKTFLLPGIYILKVNILKVNGETDDLIANNYMEKIITAGVTSGQRKVCIEHFTSSTCVPCVNVNKDMADLLQDNPGKFGITKYQMNWPVGGDPYYTLEGYTRRMYYGVNGIPKVYFNGESTPIVYQDFFDIAYNQLAFMDIAGIFNVSGTNITVNFDISSYITTQDVRVYAIVNEKKTTDNVGGNGETEFFHVMMKMLPNAEGTTTSFNEGEIKSFSFTQNMSETFVEEIDDLEVHVFIQNHDTKYIYNSNFLIENNTHFYPPNNLALKDNGDETVSVTWDVPEQGSPSGYNIYLNGELIQSNFNGTNYTTTFIEPTGYQAFRVNAVYGANISASISGYIILYGCPPPESVDAVQIGNDVILTWQPPPPNVEIDSYNINLDGTLHQDNITDTTYTFVNAPEGTHKYGVSAILGECESEIVEKELTITYILELVNVFTIYPNPAENYFEIKGNYMTDILLYNILGQLVKTITINNNYHLITTTEMNKGIYFVKIYSTDNQIFIKILVIK